MGKNRREKSFRWILVLVLVSAFQVLSFSRFFIKASSFNLELFYVFSAFMGLEWLYLIFHRLISRRKDFQLEIIAFFLSGIGLVVCASFNNDFALKQALAIGLGLLTHIGVLLISKNTDIAMFLRVPAAVASLGLLAFNLLVAKTKYGTLNWIEIAGFSVQPSELVKVAFVFVGAVTLQKIQSTKSLTKYLIFSVTCIGALFLMKDFGTALIFFFTFVVIAFMRSGDVRSIFLVSTGAALGGGMVLYFKPYVVRRFATYRHIWENMDTGGYQQTRVLIYMASGGLFGLGIGEGKLRNVYAASTDLVFGLVCEEFGLLLGLFILTAYGLIALYALIAANRAASTFYSMAAVCAASMILFQVSLNVFGITDLLPLTGVTLPFISRGGTSMISSWGLLALIRAVGLFGNSATHPANKRLEGEGQ
ncbi:MAG TPA: FtsW/RodA/SpoVE family cell cycle protein [Clostridiales bacterium]|nr:FtsW/RodA/SpoVE family cell cycle protein [Clostridiales bacterium]